MLHIRAQHSYQLILVAMTFCLSSVGPTWAISLKGIGQALGNTVKTVGEEVNKAANSLSQPQMQTQTSKGCLIQDTPLKDLFCNHPYDRRINDPYPRVAVTVKEVPPFHNEFRTLDRTIDVKGNYLLSAVIWHSATESETVDNFIFRFPQDVCYNMALRNFTQWGAYPYIPPMLTSLDEEGTIPTSGPKRTNGPLIPEKSLPVDFKHQRFYSTSIAGELDLSSYDGIMVCSLLYQMGFDWNEMGDKRVWVVEFTPALRQ